MSYTRYVQKTFLKENLCVLQVFLCALISRPHSLEGTLPLITDAVPYLIPFKITDDVSYLIPFKHKSEET